MKKNKIMDFFSALGRSLLMPIAALAACGIFLGLSSALMKAQVQEAMPFLSQTYIYFIIYTINKVAGVVFTLIPVLFAISIAFGMVKEEKEIAAFAGFIGYYTFLVASAAMINSGFADFSALKISNILGVEGCLNIFLQFVDQVPLADLAPFTIFLGQGKMPMMMFGLPAAALAIYQTSPEEKKPKVKALMIAGVAASIVSGITEPLEFSFMFIAPQLFLFHAVMGGLSFALMAALNVIIGNTGGGLIDYMIWGVFQPGSHWYWVIVVGIPFAIIYYVVFKRYLTKKNISIDVAEEEEDMDTSLSMDEQQKAKAYRIIEGLGGVENILAANNCLTRLRVDLVDPAKVREDILKKTGASGFIRPTEKHIQVVYGPKVEAIAANVRECLKAGPAAAKAFMEKMPAAAAW